jgi:tRNA(His) guanylyltransferase
MQRIAGKTASWEIYSGLKARGPLMVRADGRGFKKVLEGCQKPYDLEFARSISGAAQLFLSDSGLDPALAFVFSDEVNLLFWDAPLGGRVEKLDSLIAGFLSGALSLSLKRVVSMDCRVIPICESEARDYLIERQDETWRNHIFSYGFYALISDGQSPSQAMEALRGMKESQIHELLFKRGINLSKTPAWERRGVLVYRKGGEIILDWEPPLFRSNEGAKLLDEIAGIDTADTG